MKVLKNKRKANRCFRKADRMSYIWGLPPPFGTDTSYMREGIDREKPRCIQQERARRHWTRRAIKGAFNGSSHGFTVTTRTSR